MDRSIAMYKRVFASIFFLASVAAAFAQPGVHERERDSAVDGQSAGRGNQERRAALRNALQAQRSQEGSAEQGGRSDRQLSVRERGELRQQLRQQKQDGDRK